MPTGVPGASARGGEAEEREGRVPAEGPVAGGGSTAGKALAVRRMFSAVAPRYDLLNHLLSLNIDRRWRRRAVDRLLERCDPAGVVLDSCAGTLDLARELAGRSRFRGHVVACDFAEPMLARGRSKVRRLPVAVAAADALRLPLADGAAAGAMVAFGVRNLSSLDEGLAEFARVVRSGGPLVILEFTTPTRQPLRSAYLLYFRRILPFIGRLISGHDSAYSYLPESVLEFPAPQELASRMEGAGFRDVKWQSLTGGIAAIHMGIRAD